MFDAKLVADFITAARGLLGFVMIWLGLTQGANALPIVVALMLLDWTGDFVDGGIAKRSRHSRHTWIGDSDIYVDAFMSVCLGIYLIDAGFVGFTFGFCYLLGWLLVLWRFGLDKNLLMLAQTPIYLWFILIVLRLFPELGNWLIIWVLVALTINWRRFTKDIVPKFISGIASMLRGRHS
ncbi:MAG TPA: hypothetical protein VLT51_05580 [Anaerolineales bacterium]|nr:hypothetical protein [Anaerolineales bacterium]